MKYGIREICEVVLKAKATTPIGKKTFYKGEPVLYFDTLKTSSLEGSSTTVYAQGGRGNARLMSWDGEKTMTFTMEDALISPEGLMILAGAGLLDAATTKPLYQHITETVDKSAVTYASGTASITVGEVPANSIGGASEEMVYVMFVKDGEIVSEPFIGTVDGTTKKIDVKAITRSATDTSVNYAVTDLGDYFTESGAPEFDSVMCDYYTKRTSNMQQIEITADSFGSSFYLEASTLFRNEKGQDLPAEFVIPNCRVQSNFTFSMAASGDPSTFTFTMDAFPDYTRFDKTKKVLCAIQVYDENADKGGEIRTKTNTYGTSGDDFVPVG